MSLSNGQRIVRTASVDIVVILEYGKVMENSSKIDDAILIDKYNTQFDQCLRESTTSKNFSAMGSVLESLVREFTSMDVSDQVIDALMMDGISYLFYAIQHYDSRSNLPLSRFALAHIISQLRRRHEGVWQTRIGFSNTVKKFFDTKEHLAEVLKRKPLLQEIAIEMNEDSNRLRGTLESAGYKDLMDRMV